MYFSVALCDLVGRMYCSTFSAVPGTSCCPVMLIGGIPRLLMAVAQALGSDMGIVMELETMVMLRFPSGERHTKGMRKWDLKFPFLGGIVIQVLQKDVHLFGQVKGKSKVKNRITFQRRQIFGFLLWQNPWTLLTWTLCDLQAHFNSASCHRRARRREAGVTLHSVWLCIDFYNTLHQVVCSTSAPRFNGPASWHFLSPWPIISAQKVAAASTLKCWHTHVQTHSAQTMHHTESLWSEQHLASDHWETKKINNYQNCWKTTIGCQG